MFSRLLLYACILGLIVLNACDNERIYEENKEFSDHFWAADSTLDFKIAFENPDSVYTLFVNIRNTNNYEFHNIFLKYLLISENQDTIKDELQEFYLFDPKTGQPYGAGLGDIYDHRMPMIENLKVPAAGTYHLLMRQYMRRDSLNELLSAGFRLEYHKK